MKNFLFMQWYNQYMTTKPWLNLFFYKELVYKQLVLGWRTAK